MILTGDRSKIRRLRKLGASVLNWRKSNNRPAQRPGPVVARPALRSLQASVSAVLVFALTLVSMPVVPLIAPFGTPAAEAVDLPATTSSSISLQTSGPNAGLSVGDYYTTAPGSGGGGQDHLIEITVPQSWPGLPVTVALYDPELQSPGGGTLVANDEIRGTADTATFTLHDLTGTPIVSQTYTSGGGTNGLWTELITFTPAGPGTYRLFTSTSDNDDNAWRLRVVTDPDCASGCSSAELDDGDETDNPDGIAGSGDELKVGVQRSTFQHVGAGLVCNDFYFFVDGLQTSIALNNFGMDSVAGASVTYTLPDGSTQPGTVSADSRWNGSTNTTRVGDIFSVDSSRVGWWKATICLDSATQYIFEGIQGKPVYLEAIPLRPQLTLTKDDGSATAAVGDTITYDLTISNTSAGVGAGAARQIVLRDTLPNGVNFVSGSFSPGVTGGVSHASGVVTFVLDQALPAGSSTTVQVTAQVVAPSGKTITNTARVLWKDGLGNQYPPVTATDVDTLTGTDLGVAKGVDNAIPNVGDTVVFTVNVTHYSGDPATGVVVNDKLPIGLSYQSHSASVGTYDNVTGDWTVGAIGAGGTATLTITANVVGSSGVYNIAEITAADQFDPDSTPGNSSTTEDDYALVNLAVGGGGTVCWLVADNGSPQTNGNDLLTIFANGVETFIDTGGASGTGTTAIESIAFQPVTEILYAANGGQFGSINTATGEFAAIGPGGLGDVDGMAFDLITLKLYGAQRLGGNDRLIEINPATGTIVAGAFGGADFLVIDTLSAVGVGDIDDFAIDPVDNRLYGIANDGGTQDRLVLVDRSTGAVTDVGSTAPAIDLEGLSFDNAGTLFATTGTSSELLQLDKATGAPVAGSAVGLAYGDYESVDCDTNGFNTIAGTVFLDQNSDGILNGSDTGTQNVTVRIYRDDDGSGTISAGDPVVGTKITDSGGGYLFTMSATGKFLVDINTSTLPAGATMTTDNFEDADFGSSHGLSDLGNNFGYSVPGTISVVKTSDATPSTKPGDTITYTIVATNDGSGDQTGVTISDGLPGGTTYVAGSTTAAWGATSQATPALDNFNSTTSSWVSGTGPWLTTAWTEIGETDGPNGGDIRVDSYRGRQAVRIQDNDNGTGEGIQRAIDLSNYGSATLSYLYSRDLNDSDDTSFVSYSTDGTNFTTLASYVGGVNDSGYQSAVIPLPPAALTSNTIIRFVAGPTAGGGERVYYDDITVSGVIDTAQVKTNAASSPNPLVDGVPGDLVETGDGVNLAAGQSVTVTFSVVIDSPAPSRYIVNTVTAASDQSSPDSFTVIDELAAATISDFVWDDLNGDGIQDPGEPGIDGVAVELLNGVGAVYATTTTSLGGNYFFSWLPNGDYSVRFLAPAGYFFSPQDQGGDDTLDSDVSAATGETGTITVQPGDEITTVDAGVFTTATIGDLVWDDLNADGIFDAGEPVFEGATLELLDSVGAVTATTTSDATGAYSFEVNPGTYSVRITYPAGSFGSPADQGSDEAVDSDANPATGETAQLTVASGDNYGDLDFGLYTLGSIGDFVWDDSNANGIQDGGEPGIGGVQVELLDGATVVDTTTTAIVGTVGAYSFTDLVPGVYTLRFITPPGYVATAAGGGSDPALDSDPNPSTGVTDPVTVTSGSSNTDIDAGFYLPMAVGDFVFVDADSDGIQDPGELGAAGLTVNLLDAINAVVATTTTGADGSYGFADLDPALYRVEVLAPGFTFTAADQGADDALDSDVNASTGVTGVFTMAGGVDNLTIDAGILPSVLGDLVWDDLNGNGIQDAGEPGIDGVTVNLLDGGGAVIATTTTSGGGTYSFGVGPGTYQIEFVAPAGLEFGPAGQGGDTTIDSDADVSSGRSAPITVTDNSGDLTIDAALYSPITLGNTVFVDADADGIQDVGETGLAGVTVQLRNSSGTVIDTDITDGSGNYSFAGLAPGDYTVVFTPSAGYFLSPADQGADDAADSDADATTGITGTITLTSGVDDDSVDAGMFELGSVADFAWVDLDSDGIQDAGEPGLAGVTVNLLDGATVVATATTAADGSYLITNVVPGAYTVEFVAAGYTFTAQDVGADDSVDSDSDASGLTATVTVTSGLDIVDVDAGVEPVLLGDFVWVDTDGDGVQDSGETGLDGVTVELLSGATVIGTTTTAGGGAYAFAVAPGTYTIRFTEPAGYSLTTLDAGADDAVDSDADSTSGITGTITVAGPGNDDSIDAGMFEVASIGDFIFDDLDADGVQDPGEPGIDGITVELRDAGGSLVATDISSGGGSYGFAGLNPGDYTLTFFTPSGASATTANAGSDDAVDSDINAVGVVSVSLVSGEVDESIDAGFVTPASIGDFVWDDLNGNGIQDPGEPGLENVTVRLLQGATEVASVQTDSAGAYSFVNVAPGAYVIEFGTIGSYGLTSQDQGGDDDLDSDADSTTGLTSSFTVVSGDGIAGIDAGLVAPASIGDTVFFDTNNDGLSTGEPGVPAFTVELLQGGSVIASTTTDASGSYSFGGLAPGDYAIQVPAAGVVFAAQDTGGDDGIDSDVDATGVSGTVTLTSNETNISVDVGILPSSVSNFVWTDTNGNGVQDPGEPGLDGVTVELYDGTGTTLIASTTTAGGGLYAFTNLLPGDYEVRVTAPVGVTFTGLNSGADDSLDSDVDSAGSTGTFSLAGNTDDDTVDAGVFELASIGDFVWDDLNGNGVQDAGEPGVSGVLVELRDGSGTLIAADTTSFGGAWSISGIDPGTYTVTFTLPAGSVATTIDAGADDGLDSDIDAAGDVAITLTTGDAVATIDAGVVFAASVGDYVWDDLNGDGIQDSGEPGIDGVQVDLLQGGVVVQTDATAGGGAYSFDVAPGDYQLRFTPSGVYGLTAQDVGADDALDSDANPTTGETDVFTVASGDAISTMDAGLLAGASIGDQLFFDVNGDGTQDAGEPGVAGVVVELLQGGSVVATTTSLADGSYSFGGLNPGSYVVRVPGAGLVFTTQDAGSDDALDSDVNASGVTGTIVLTSGEIEDSIDAGILPSSVGDFVWLDSNGDGVQDSGEPGRANVTVALLNGSGTVVATTTTNAGGAYLFDLLLPGTYSVQFTAPAGYVFTGTDVGADDALDSDANASGLTASFPVSPSSSPTTVDAGLFELVSVGDFVFDDLNANGVQDAGEPGIDGVAVSITGPSGPLSTTTSGGGAYSFASLVPGDYTLTFTGPAGSAPTGTDVGGDDAVDSDIDGSGVVTVTLASGDSDTSVDAGFVTPATIGNFVWDDLDGDGIQDLFESGLGGVTVQLLQGGTVVQTTTSAADGSYQFTVAPGTYTVNFGTIGTYELTAQDATGADAFDSDANPTTGDTDPFTVTSGQTQDTIDAGLVAPASIGDTVFFDTNADGLSTGEPGVPGVAVELLQGGTVIATTTTDGSGNYGFTGLAPGDYAIQLPGSGFVFATPDAGADDTLDSDVDASGQSGTVTLISAQDNTSIDAGVLPSSIGNLVWLDNNGNGIQDGAEPGINGVSVELLDGTGGLVATTTTSGGGLYSFDLLLPGTYEISITFPLDHVATAQAAGTDTAIDSNVDSSGDTGTFSLAGNTDDDSIDAGLYVLASVGDFVWDDLDGNGIQDAGEPGIENVVVELRDAGGALVTTDTTDALGIYGMSGLIPGDYTITFVPPAGYSPTIADAGSDDFLDSDQNASGAAPIQLLSGSSVVGLDAGFVSPGTIGDFVFTDVNGNGIQDSGEAGIGGVAVALIQGGSVVDTTTTDGSGLYSFTPGPGNYSVQFTAPAGYVFTGTDVGADDALDSDADASGRTGSYVLPSGGNIDSVDAGLFELVSVGDFVFDDLNANGVQDAGEPGIDGVAVSITGPSGPLSTTTSGGGAYSFASLVPGDYTLTFTGPAGSAPTGTDVGGDDAVDSDIDGSGVVTVTLASGDSDTSVDAGFVTPATIGNFVWDDLDGDGIQGSGEPGISGIAVELIDDGGSVVQTTTTGGTGSYQFANVAPGTYTVRFTPGGTYRFTGQTLGGDGNLDSDPDQVTGVSDPFTVTSGEVADFVDAGLLADASIGNLVFLDRNDDGIQDAGEPGAPDITVELLDGAGTVLGTVQTASDGTYSFDGLNPGSYRVRVPGAGRVFSPQDVGADDTVDSDVDASGVTDPIVVISGQADTTVDVGLPVGSIGDLVWLDNVGDGLLDASESGLDGVTVELLQVGSVIATTTTAGGGFYLFDLLLPGDYQVRVTAPVGYVFTGQSQGADPTIDSDVDSAGLTGVISVSAADDLTVADAGLFQTTSVSNFVWDDLNGNGIQDAGEPGIDGVVIELRDSDGVLVDTQTTAGGGLYAFTDLNPGTYTLTFSAPAGAAPTGRDVGSDDAVDSDITGAGVVSVTLNSGEVPDTIDAGYVTTATLGNFVWDDLDGDGVQDAGEPGVGGVVVELLNAAGTPVTSVVTAADGSYTLAGVFPGTYTMRFTAPAGTSFTTADVGSDDAVDSDAVPVPATDLGVTSSFTVQSGDTITTIDAGLLFGATIGDFVFNDLDTDGIQDAGEPGVDGIGVQLLSGATVVASTTTSGGGAYTFTNVVPGTYTVQVVLPVDATPTTVDVGANDAVDSDIDGSGAVTVTVSSGESVNTIDAGLVFPGSIGDFVFEDTDGDGIQDGGETGVGGITVNLLDGSGTQIATTTTAGDGSYSFTGLTPGDYQIEFVPSGVYGLAPQDSGSDDGLDSDADPITGRTAVFTLLSDETIDHVDAGVIAGGSIGDRIFFDDDGDGIDNGEPGVPGATIELLNGSGTVVGTTTTDANGNYTFGGLTPNLYSIRVTNPGVVFTTANVGADDDVDSDADATGTTNDVFLTSGLVITNLDVGVLPSSISDLVFTDTNGNGLQDAGEPGLAGVTVDLLDGAGTLLATTTTSAAGLYSFDLLLPGTYEVSVSIPAGFAATAQSVGTDTAIDSNIDAAGDSGTFTLAGNTTDDSIDAGLYQYATIGDTVFVDLNDDGVQTPGEPGVDGLTVNVLQGGSTIATTTTAGGGLYSFTGLTPGDYAIEVVAPGFTFVAIDAGSDDALDSDVDASGVSAAVSLVSGETNSTIDAGVAPSTIGDLVFNDLNGNGIQNGLDAGIDGVVVNLLDGGGNLIATTTTAGGGLYSFTVAPGTYEIEFEALSGTTFTATDVGSDDALDSDADQTTGRTGPIVVTGSTSIDTVDGGLVSPATIGDLVWQDLNGDGVRDPGEPGLDDITINLVDSGGAVIDSQVTAGGGLYDFAGVAPGTYTVDVVSVPGGYVLTTTEPLSGLTVSSGQDYNAADFGYQPTGSISIVKDPATQDVVVDGTANFTITLTNTGSSTLGNVSVSDLLVPACNQTFASMAPGAVETISCSLTSVTADFTNTATVAATGPGGISVTDTDTADVTVLVPGIDIEKNPDTQTVVINGSADFSITVTNTGDTALTSVTVSDPSVPGCDLVIGDLAVGADSTHTCSLSGVTSDFTNTASVSALDPIGNFTGDTDTAFVDVITPRVTISKTPDTQSVAPNGTANFTITVTNTGDADLTNVTVGDPLSPDCDSVVGPLAVGASSSYPCSLTNVSSGFTNTATVTAQDPTGGSVSDSDTAEVLLLAPSVGIVKDTTTPTIVSGDVANFSITVTNNGDAPLSAISVSDPTAPNCDITIANMAVGESQTYTCDSEVATADFTNTANVTAYDPVGNVLTASDSVDVSVINPDIQIVKDPATQGVAPGGTANFTITVTNTGDSVLSNVVVSDPQVPACDFTVASLAAGADAQNTCSLTGVTASFTNNANVSATDESGATVFDSDTAFVQTLSPRISITKNPATQQIHNGSTATFSINVANTGDADLTNISVSDALAPNCDTTIAQLLVGQSQTYTCDIAGIAVDFTNTASVSSEDPAGNVVSDSDTADVDVINPAISIAKTPDTQDVLPDGTATFTITVTNTGDVPLTGVTVSDPMSANCNNNIGDMAVAEVVTYTCTRTNVTGDFTNTANVTGTDPISGTVSDSDTADVTMIVPGITIEKTTSTPQVVVGGDATFTITVTNSGTAPLDPVVVSDPQAPDCARNLGAMVAGAVVSYDCTLVGVLGDFTNSATATGTDASGSDVTSSDTAAVDAISPEILVSKTPDSQSVIVNGEATFTITVTNVGDVPLTDVTVSDPLAPNCDSVIGDLPASTSTSYDCTLSAITNDFTNTANVTGTHPVSGPVESSDSADVTVLTPGVNITKTTSTPTVRYGADATFDIVVANSGQTDLANVVVSDPQAPDCDRTFALIALGASESYSCTLTNVTGPVTNTATVNAEDAVGNIVSSSDDASVDVIDPTIEIQKTPDLQQLLAGETATFSIMVTNQGDVDLTAISVTDAASPNCDQGVPDLAPGEDFTYTCTLDNVPSDFTNTAMVEATDPLGLSLSDSDDAVVDVVNPGIDIQKTPDTQTILDGGVATFTLTVTNNGDQDIADASISDPAAPLCDVASTGPIAVGETFTITCDSPVLTDDIVNVATVDGSDILGNPVSASDDAAVDVIHPDISVDKTPDAQAVVVNGIANFVITVANTGDVDLTNVTVSDPQAPDCDAVIPLLAAGTSTTINCSLSPVPADFTNTVNVTGTDPLDNELTASDTADVTVLVPGLTVSKGPDYQVIPVNGDATFTITVTNSGQTPLANVVLDDPLSPVCNNTIATLAVGQTSSYDCTVTTVASDFINEITATATDPVGGTVTSTDDAIVDVIAPAISIEKTPDTQTILAGSDATFTITVTNIGDVALTGVTVTDPATPACDLLIGNLAPAADSMHTCVQSGVTASFTNQADVTASDPAGGTVTDSDTGDVVAIQIGSLTGLVFLDADADALFNNSDTLLSTVQVDLIDSAGNIFASTTTQPDGSYTFLDVPVGDYTVDVVDNDPNIPAGSILTTANDPQPVSVAANRETSSTDVGFAPPSILTGRAFNDADSNGVDGGEPGVGAVTVNVWRDTTGDGTPDTVVATTLTASDGTWTVDALLAGTYAVEYVTPAGQVVTLQDVGGDDTVDSDIDPITGFTSEIALATGTTIGDLDAGYYPPATIGDLVFSDADGNGIFDSGEVGQGGVNVVATWAGPDGTLGNGDDQTFSATSASDGSYQIAGLPGGVYSIVVIEPLGSTVTTGNDPIQITLPTGAVNNDIDYGLDGNGVVGGSVYVDTDNDGIKDVGEAGLENVAITLTGNDANGVGVSLSTITDINGDYLFANLNGGTYTITEAQPGAFMDGIDTVGTAGGDNSVNDVISNVVLPLNFSAFGYNFGEIAPSSLSGTVRLTSGEPIQGVTITLTGTDDLGAAVNTSVVTGADGLFTFVTLRPGNYTVTETQPVIYGEGGETAGTAGGDTATNVISNILLISGTTGTEYVFAETSALLSGTVYSDVDNSGTLDAGENGIPGVTLTLTGTDLNTNPVSMNTLTAADGTYTFGGLLPGTYTITELQPVAYADGAETVGSLGGDASVNDRISAINVLAGETGIGYNFGETGTVVTGSVFLDLNADGTNNAGDTPLAGVIVELLDAAGNQLAVTSTTSTGDYSFSGLFPGNYIVHEIQPAEWGSTTPNEILFTLTTAGASGLDFGEKAGSISGVAFADAEFDGISSGDGAVPGVTVNLVDSSGATVATATTDVDGAYAFTGLPADTYAVIITPPAGSTFSPADVGSDDTIDSDFDPSSGSTLVPLTGGQDVEDLDAGLTPINHDAGVVVTVPETTYRVNEDVPFTVVATNNSNVAVDDGLMLVMAVPTDAVVISAVADGWTITQTGTVLTATFAEPLALNQAAPPIVITMQRPTAGALSLEATVSFLDPTIEDDNANNDASAAAVTVAPPNRLPVPTPSLPVTGVTTALLLIVGGFFLFSGKSLTFFAGRPRKKDDEES